MTGYPIRMAVQIDFSDGTQHDYEVHGNDSADLLALIADLDTRVAKALEFAALGVYDGGHHKMWALDQMVRALTGCPVESVTMTDYNDVSYSYDAQGKSAVYQQFVTKNPGWDEGIAP